MTADNARRAAEERLARWVREHAGAVRGYLLGITRRADVADDLVQEVFERAWRGREGYHEEGHERAFLLRIADRLAIDRSRREQPEINLDELMWREVEPAARDQLPLDALTQVETSGELVTALQQLTPAQTRVLLLRFFGDLTFEEIAETLDCPLGTALSHCRRGLAAMRQLLTAKTV